MSPAAEAVLPLRGQRALLLRTGRTWQMLGAGFAVWAEHQVFWEFLTILYVTIRFYVEIFFSKREDKSVLSVTAVIFLSLFVSHIFTTTLNFLVEVKGGIGCATTLDHMKPPIHEVLEVILWIPRLLLFSGRKGRHLRSQHRPGHPWGLVSPWN